MNDDTQTTGGDTRELFPPRPTKSLLPMRSAFQTGDTLDSLRRAFVANYRLLTSGENSLMRLARMALLAIRKSAALMFGSPEVADAFLMGGY